MRHSIAVFLVLLLVRVPGASEVLAQQTDTTVAAQDTARAEAHGGSLEQNYPNPFRRDTRIPLVLGADLFEDGRPVVVSVRIYNVLRQVVAVPTALDHPFSSGQPALELRYDAPGRYLLYWDGSDREGRRVPSGIYFCEMIAAGSRDVRKMMVTR
jgi:hypothetical protein